MTADQEKALAKFGREAVIALAHRLIENADEIVGLAGYRASTVGVREYGDVSYHKTIEHLECEVDEELADAVFYQHIILVQRHERAAAAG